MSKKKLYTDSRWTDIPKPIKIGTVEETEEEREKIDAECEAFLKEMGVLRPEDKIEDFKIK